MNGKTEKYLKLAANMLTLLPIAVCAAAICAAPEQIGGHWNAAGELDRLGSKWELVIWPLMVLFVRGTMAVLTVAVTDNSGVNRRVMRWATVCVLALFDAMAVYFTYCAVTRAETLSIYSLDVWQLTNIVLGAVFIPIGNLMPKLRMNALAGYRTKWSMSNERAWSLAQRHAGRAMVVSGAAMLLIGLLADGLKGICLSVCVLALALIIADRRAKNEYNKTEPPE